VGLTPSQYASAAKVRMGRITGIGKNTLRAILVEASWQLITKDQGSFWKVSAAWQAGHESVWCGRGSSEGLMIIWDPALGSSEEAGRNFESVQ
jgi:hypothetical protein